MIINRIPHITFSNDAVKNVQPAEHISFRPQFASFETNTEKEEADSFTLKANEQYSVAPGNQETFNKAADAYIKTKPALDTNVKHIDVAL